MEFLKTFVSWLPNFSNKISTSIITVDWVFRFHYGVVAPTLFMFSLFTAVLLMFDWVQCYSSTLHIPSKMLNIYCWMQNSFVLPHLYTNVQVGSDVAYPGIGKSTNFEERQYISYYQWIPLVLLFQGIFFKVPHYLWKMIEHDEMINLAVGYQFPIAKHPMQDGRISENDINEHLHLTANYIQSRWSKRKSSIILYCIFVCANLANVVGNIFILNNLFKSNFHILGWQSFLYFVTFQIYRTDPLMSIFPRMVKCSYYDFGAGGSVQSHDVLCVLPYNVYNEKLFGILLFVFTILSILTALELLFWLLMCMIKKLRNLMTKCPIIFSTKSATKLLLTKKHNIGDWFFIWLLTKNMHEVHLNELLKILQEKLPNDAKARNCLLQPT
ncbi:hypothetical protein CHUAL_001897 [Chamberlinius hualienensis]